MWWWLTNVSLLHSLFFCPSPVSISCGGIALFRVRAQSKGLPKKAKSKLSQDKYKAMGTAHKKHTGRPKNERFSHPFGVLVPGQDTKPQQFETQWGFSLMFQNLCPAS